MSESSGDSSIGVEPSAITTVLLDQSVAPSQDQESGLTKDSSEFESCSSSEEECSNAALVEATLMSKKLGHVDIFAMSTKLDEIHAWMKGLVDDSTEDHVYIQKSTLRRHKKGIDTMRHCLRDTAPMAVKTSQYMEATVKRYIAANVHKAIEKMSKSEGAGCAAMKELLAQPAFKPNFLEEIEQEVLKDDKFPHEKSTLLNAEIGEIVSFHLGCALFKQAQKQTENKYLEKFRAKTKEALDGVKEELQGAGLMK